MKHLKCIVIVEIILIVSSLMACGKKTENTIADNQSQIASNTGKGRYVESQIELPQMEYPSNVYELEDDTLCIYDKSARILYKSDTTHSTWTKQDTCNVDKLGEIEYVQSIAFAKNGDCIVEYIKNQEDASGDSFKPTYSYITSDGAVTDLDLKMDEHVFFMDFLFADDNRLFGYTFKGGIYEIIKDSGNAKLLYSMAESPVAFDVMKHFLITADSTATYFYNLQENELDEINQDVVSFLKEQNVNYEEAAGTGTKCFLFSEDDDGSFYILLRNGLFHFVGGETMEQIIDGNLNSINNPSYTFSTVIKEKDGSFLIFYEQGKLMRYSYNSDISSSPENQLKIYSLTESQSIRQVISQFQNLYPDYKIDYEIGMTGNDGITYEDAVKNLNTELISGDGPDILVMDDLNMDNYIEKDILINLSDYKEQLKTSQKILPNIVEGFEREDGLYAVPIRFQIPVLVAKKDIIDKVYDYPSLANTIEEIRSKDGKHGITNQFTEKDVLRNAFTYYGNFYSSKKGLDEEKLKEALMNSKTIYENEIIALTEEEMQDFKENMDSHETENASWMYQVSGKAMSIVSYGNYIATGRVYSLGYDLNIVTTLENEYDYISYQFGLYENDTRFFPSCILGITSLCEDKEAAVNFIMTALSKEVQSVDMGEGISVNEDVIQDELNKGIKGEIIGAISMSDSDTGVEFGMDVKYPNETQGKEFMAAIKKLDTPVVMDRMVRDTILEFAPSYIDGYSNLEDTMKNISDKVKLRLSE